MPFMDATGTTTTAIGSVSNSPGVDGEVGEEAAAVELQDPRGAAMAPHPDAPRTGLLCQVGSVSVYVVCV